MFHTETPAILAEDFRDFPQSLQENSGMVPRLGHDRFLPNPFRYIIIHLLSCHPTLYGLDTELREISSIAVTT
jgi:hypothetical protein